MISKVAIIGAGAIGGYFIDCFSHNDTIDVVVIATDRRKERLETQGITVNNKHFDLQVKTPKECGAVDLVLVSTKYNGLQEVCDYLPLLIKEDTLVLSLLNGVDSEKILSESIDPNHIVYSLMRISAERDGQNIIYRLGNGLGLFYGSDDPAILERLDAFFSQTPVLYQVKDDIMTDIWYKYASNISNNLPQAIIQSPMIVYSYEHAYFIASKLWEEVRMVAKSQGITLPEAPGIFQGVKKEAKFSTLQDIEAKRHTEIDMFAGVLMKMAKENNIEVPYATMTYHLIKALEQKNDGLYNV